MIVNFFYATERLHQYAAAYVYTYDIRYHLIAQIAGKTNYTTCPRMHIGHDADFAFTEHIDGKQLPDLFFGHTLNIVGKNLYIVIFYSLHNG